MAEVVYCWRCETEVPMLTKEEWAELSPLLDGMVEEVQLYRTEHNCSLEVALKNGFGKRALEKYEQMTGFPEVNPNALYHHRLSLYGPPCVCCGKRLRTPKASYCADCGKARMNESDG